MSNPNPSPAAQWKKGQSGNPQGAKWKGTPWKKLIKEIGDEDTPEQWRHLGATYKEAVIRLAYHKILEGKVEYLDWFMKYSEPNATEINLQITDWHNFENLGISEKILIERAAEINKLLAQKAQGLLIDGEYRVSFEESASGRSDNAGGSQESNDGEGSGETALDTTSETTTPNPDPSL